MHISTSFPLSLLVQDTRSVLSSTNNSNRNSNRNSNHNNNHNNNFIISEINISEINITSSKYSSSNIAKIRTDTSSPNYLCLNKK